MVSDNRFFFRFFLVVVRSIFLLPFISLAQTSNQLHFDINNGLPSNHVYDIRVDKYGYLWMATSNGVVKYNGYYFEIFDMSNGLPNNDVWNLYIDNKSRVWLGTIADELGYIYHDKYHTCKNLTDKKTLYPLNITSQHDVLYFLINNSLPYTLMYVQNDTIKAIKYLNQISAYIRFSYVTKNYILIFKKNKIYKISLNGKISISNSKYLNDTNVDSIYSCYGGIYFNNFIIENKFKNNYFVVLEPNGKIRSILLPKSEFGNIYLFSKANNFLNVYTPNAIYIYDSMLSLSKVVKKSSILSDNYNIIFYSENKFWGKVIGTDRTGFYENYSENNFFKRNAFNLNEYSNVGIIGDSIGLWWDKYLNILQIITKSSQRKKYQYRSLVKLYSIIEYCNNRYLLCGTGFDFINTDNYSLIDSLSKKFKNYIENNEISWGLRIKANVFYVYSNSQSGLNKLTYIHDSFYYSRLDYDKYNGITFDSTELITWVYNGNKILLIDSNEHKLFVNKRILEIFGIGRIDKIYIDKYGNIFVKDNSHLHFFNLHKHINKILFSNYTIASAKFLLYKNSVVLAGSFGVLFSKINGPGSINKPVVYRNIKGLKYHYIDDWQVCYGKVLLKTDKGTYLVDVPSDSVLANPASIKNDQYRVVLNYNNDDYTDISNNDSFKINQLANSLKFDVINPFGYGKVSYSYKLSGETSWKLLNANELVLQHLKPDHYYTLSLIAQDNAWQSDPINIHLYIIPYWWQTQKGIRAIGAAALILFALMIWAVVYSTRRILNRANERKNLRHDLELKSIYSQINPHFIFNTLSSSLLLIQKKKFDDAYIHVSKFSRLLRSYMKSSRNKYITIADEIGNLTTYIELQQSRFKDHFTYEIVTDPGLETEKISIPALLLQPIVENAINHGLFHKKDIGYLKIIFQLDKKKGELVITVDDNGVGRRKARLIKEESSLKQESYGSDLIKDLIRIFNTYEKMNITINYIDKELPSSGTTVIITIKNYLYDANV